MSNSFLFMSLIFRAFLSRYIEHRICFESFSLCDNFKLNWLYKLWVTFITTCATRMSRQFVTMWSELFQNKKKKRTVLQQSWTTDYVAVEDNDESFWRHILPGEFSLENYCPLKVTEKVVWNYIHLAEFSYCRRHGVSCGLESKRHFYIWNAKRR